MSFPGIKNRFLQLFSSREKCPQCGTPVESAYLLCPICHFQLKTNCSHCGKIVETKWNVCPYCQSNLAEKTF